ncbi:hypothetical protein XBI1_1560001 [Xenorhabdus bovienii str. Intermedium]|uniref:Uncharacterized protein n=1 Tax=Xenorhabdus bovienii str. Intermedium TaxID=1379677 RepID=A0A077QDD2_XENBV|nr:hypothetical protein XBI1_1560001 [Xenorhabdus bovienii str. Intermedium]
MKIIGIFLQADNAHGGGKLQARKNPAKFSWAINLKAISIIT